MVNIIPTMYCVRNATRDHSNCCSAGGRISDTRSLQIIVYLGHTDVCSRLGFSVCTLSQRYDEDRV